MHYMPFGKVFGHALRALHAAMLPICLLYEGPWPAEVHPVAHAAFQGGWATRC